MSSVEASRVVRAIGLALLWLGCGDGSSAAPARERATHAPEPAPPTRDAARAQRPADRPAESVVEVARDGCFQARFDEAGITIAAGLAVGPQLVLIDDDGARYLHVERAWRRIAPSDPPATPELVRARSIPTDDGARPRWRFVRHAGARWISASPLFDPAQLAYPSRVDVDPRGVLASSHTHGMERVGDQWVLTARERFAGPVPVREIGRSARGWHAGLGGFLGVFEEGRWRRVEMPAPAAVGEHHVEASEARVVVLANRTLFERSHGRWRALPRYHFDPRGLLAVTADRVDVLTYDHTEGFRLLRIESDGARERPIDRSGTDQRLETVVTDDQLLTVSTGRATRCELGADGWMRVEPISLEWGPAAAIPWTHLGWTSGHYRASDPRYRWPPRGDRVPSEIRFDARGRMLWAARRMRCDGDGCAGWIGVVQDASSGRVLGSAASGEEAYRAIAGAYDASTPAPSALLERAVLLDVLPRWHLHLTHERGQYVVRIVDPINRHASVVARRSAVAERGQCCDDDGEPRPCPGWPYVRSAAASPGGESLFVGLGVHLPACDCHTSELALPPLRISVARMHAFARSIGARPPSDPTR